eukprot:scaffold6033_cov63-Phaeocystis_antarctica.AAC.1
MLEAAALATCSARVAFTHVQRKNRLVFFKVQGGPRVLQEPTQLHIGPQTALAHPLVWEPAKNARLVELERGCPLEQPRARDLGGAARIVGALYSIWAALARAVILQSLQNGSPLSAVITPSSCYSVRGRKLRVQGAERGERVKEAGHVGPITDIALRPQAQLGEEQRMPTTESVEHHHDHC